MNSGTSRWRRSAVSYGPVGRVVWTTGALAIATYALYAATRGFIYPVYFLFAIPIWIFLIPLVLRDVWRKVRTEEPEPPIVLPPAITPIAPGESIHDRKPPPRW